MPDADLPEHVVRNRAYWNRLAASYEEPGHRRWAAAQPFWGVCQVPEADVRLLPAVDGKDVIELGCETSYVSAWLARRGARVTGIDNSEAQLANARRFQVEFGLEFPLIHGNAEMVPLADASFDLAISEYGASVWADPYRWVPEAARLLRPGGELIFLVNGTIHWLCTPDTDDVPAGDRLLRDYFGMHRFDWPDDESVEFHLGYGDWIRLLRRSGFEVLDLVELRPAPDTVIGYPKVTLEWARRWPSEEVWKARRLG